MTPATIRTTVRNLAGLPSSDDLLTDAIIDQFIYDAQLEMARAAVSRGIFPYNIRRQTTINLVSGTAEYALPTDLLSIAGVRAKDSEGRWVTLHRRTQEDIDAEDSTWQDSDSSTSSGTPRVYYSAGQEDDTASSDFGKYLLGLSPTPDYASTGGLAVRYVTRPTALSTLAAASKSVIYIPEELHDAMCQKAAYRFLVEMTENPRGDYQQMLQYFTMSIQTYIALMGEQNQPDYFARCEAPTARHSQSYWKAY